MASLFVVVHPSKAKLNVFRYGNYFIIASTVNAYSLRQMLLQVVATGFTRSLLNDLYGSCSSGLDIAFQGI
jgi:hypothetical protein